MKNKVLTILSIMIMFSLCFYGCGECEHAFNKIYDYELQEYRTICTKCDHSKVIKAGESEDYPFLARDEVELSEVIATAKDNSFISLANDIIVTTSAYEVVQRIPRGGTLDLGGYTVTVKVNGGFTVEGENVTLQNGKVVTDYKDPKSGYALFIGDEGENNTVTIKNISSSGGFNVYNCIANVIDCEVDASNHRYYALWADEHSTINVKSGKYYGGEIACVHSCAREITEDGDGRGIVKIYGGVFHGKIMAVDLTEIHGGEFDDEIKVTAYSYDGQTYSGKLLVSKNYDKELNIVNGSADYDLEITLDENGNKIYKQVEKT